MKSTISKITAVILALIIVLSSVAFVFAQNSAPSGSGSDTQSGAPAGSDGTQSGAPAGSDGAQSGTEAPAGNSAGNEASGPNEEELKQKTDLYTVMALVALAAIVIGIREKKRRG